MFANKKAYNQYTVEAAHDEEGTPLLAKSVSEEQKRLFKSSAFKICQGLGVFVAIAALCLGVIAFLSVKYNNIDKSSMTLSGVNTKTVPAGNQPIVKATVSNHPNFVFLLIDDMGYGTIGYDDSDIAFSSPYMNSLAKDGVMLTNYYAQEICSPSRASMLTGRYPITLGLQYEELAPNVEWGLNTTEVLFSDVLKLSGTYKNYMIGKWNLGHYTPDLLPTARGFDQFIGFLSGQVYHWSKVMPKLNQYVDFMYSDTECYDAYNEEDLGTYSTFFYRDRAIDVIKSHDFNDKAMFMYLAVQAVHDPFNDNTTFSDGFPSTYFPDGLYEEYKSKIPGMNRMQYALSLRLLDDAMTDIVKALEEVGQMDNTYLIVASDNGGCYQAGGRNGNLRGCKGSLYEGKVPKCCHNYLTRFFLTVLFPIIFTM